MILDVFFFLQFSFRFLVHQSLFSASWVNFDFLTCCLVARKTEETLRNIGYWIFVDCFCCSRDILKLKAKTMLVLVLLSLFECRLSVFIVSLSMRF